MKTQTVGLATIIKVGLLSSILFLITQAQDLETNNKCHYTIGKNVFTCIGLTDINYDKNVDKYITPDTHMLIIKNSDKVTFHQNHHNNNTPNYNRIVTYQILDNGELLIEDAGLEGLINLSYLTITGNYLPKLKSGMLKGLTKLEVLNLAQNNITSIEQNVFVNLPNLITLQIAENKLDKIESSTFSRVQNLFNLLLSDNKISLIESNAFSNLKKLEILDLTRNEIEELRGDVFNPLENLKNLYLGFNRIKKISGVITLPKLMMLILINNELKEISENSLQMGALKSLDLGNNYLGNIDEKSFTHLPSLMHVNLYNNKANATGFNTLKLRTNIVL